MQRHTLSSFEGIYGCEEIKTLSTGSFGIVYLIRMTEFEQNKKAALKVFNSVGGDAYFNKLNCERERTVLRHIAVNEKINDKKLQIAHIREDIHGVYCPNLMLEYIDGYDLRSKQLSVLTFGHLLDFVQSMMDQIGKVLDDLHAMNIYHNDLKPANIMYAPYTKLFYLIDFGLAVPMPLLHHNAPEFNKTTTNFFTTLSFMSPWHFILIDGSTYSPLQNDNVTRSMAIKADFYSFALSVIEIIGTNCRASDALCYMCRRIVSLQGYSFNRTDEQAFIHWDMKKIASKLEPYWRRINERILDYLQMHPLEHTEIMNRLAYWLQAQL